MISSTRISLAALSLLISTAALAQTTTTTTTTSEVAPTPQVTLSPAQEKALAMIGTMTIFGDLRYRYESLHDQSPSTGNRENYDQERLRARLGMRVMPLNDLTVEFRLATGNGGQSTNQTFGDTANKGMRNEPFQLDRAFFKYAVCPSGSVIGGRMANPFVLVGDNDMIFDNDLNFDGLALASDHKMEAASVFARLGEFILDAGKNSTVADRKLDALELGARLPVNDRLMVTLTASEFKYSDIKGNSGIVSATNFGGNSSVGTGYAFDYNVLSGGLEVAYNIGLPLAVYAEYDKNDQTSDNNKAMIYGVRLNQLKEAGDWMVLVDQREVQKDSTLGILADGDSFGGGADGRSLRISAGYAFTKAFGAQLSAFTGTKNIADGETGVERNRYHADLNVRF
jgi:hypothetical protein